MPFDRIVGVGFKIILLVLLLCYHINASEVKNAGVLAFISSHGVDDVVKATSNYYAEELLRNVYRFNNATGTFRIGIWNWDWSLSNIQFTKVSKPYSKGWTDKYGHVVLNDLAMDLVGDFNVHSKHKLFQGQGKLSAHACFHVQLLLSIGINNTVKVEQCFTGFDCPLNIVLNMNTDYPNFIDNYIHDKIQALLKADMLCNSMSDFATDYMVHTVIRDPGFAIDLSIKTLLGVTNAGLTMALSGEVFDFAKGPLGDKNPMVAPKLPSRIVFNKNKMTTFVLSSYMVSTLILTSSRKGLLDSEINTQSLPPDKRVFFATDCKSVCIGKFIPKIGKMYPNEFVSFRIAARENIHTDINPDGMHFKNGGEFTFFINKTELFVMEFDFGFTGMPLIKPNTVIVNGKLSDYKYNNIGLVYSNVGHIPDDVLEQMTDIINKVYVLPRLNTTLEQGVDMATFLYVPNKEKLKKQIVHFIDAELELKKGYLVVSADFSLKINAIGLHTGFSDDHMKYGGANV